MAYDEAKAKAMRGDPEPDGDEGEATDEGEAPSEETIAAAKRLCAAVEAKNYRAIVAAVKDICE